MEFIYQAIAVNLKFSNKRKTGCHKFTMKLDEYSCAHNVETKVICDELIHLKLGLYTSRKHFDPKHKMQALLPTIFYKHFNLLEDFWMDLQDDYDLRRRNYERFPIPLMVKYGIKEDILETLLDDGVTLDPQYDVEKVGTKDLDLVVWNAEESIDIKKFARPVLDRSIQWVVMRIKEPKAQTSKKRKDVGTTQGYKGTKRRMAPKELLEFLCWRGD